MVKSTLESPGAGGRRKAYWRSGMAVFAVIAAAGGFYLWQKHHEPRHARAQAAIPVSVATADSQDVPIYLDALGTAVAANTVAIRSQIDGTLQSVNFVEGQEVHKGDVLAKIDSRLLQATLEQATARKAQDQAQLVAAGQDLARFKRLARQKYETQQNLDLQRAKVDQFKAMVQADQAAIDSARTQLSYATIIAPIDGRVGFRQVDPGNIVRASDSTPLTVLTQIKPVMVTFSLPEKYLADVRDAMARGPVPVTSFNQDDTQKLDEGRLLVIDNRIDQTTGTITLKARFPNEGERQWPGEFVRIRLLAETRKDAVTMPPAALQRGPQGFYVWVVKPNETVEERTVAATPIDNGTVIVTKGLKPGERVVVNGQYRLQTGMRVTVKASQSAKVARRAP